MALIEGRRLQVLGCLFLRQLKEAGAKKRFYGNFDNDNCQQLVCCAHKHSCPHTPSRIFIRQILFRCFFFFIYSTAHVRVHYILDNTYCKIRNFQWGFIFSNFGGHFLPKVKPNLIFNTPKRSQTNVGHC